MDKQSKWSELAASGRPGNEIWNELKAGLKDHLAILRTTENALISAVPETCPVCSAPLDAGVTVCPYCGKEVAAEGYSAGEWKKTVPSGDMILQTEEAWEIFSVMTRCMNTWNTEIAPANDTELMKKKIAEGNLQYLDIYLKAASEDVIFRAQDYRVMTADYILGLMGEKNRYPFQPMPEKSDGYETVLGTMEVLQ